MPNPRIQLFVAGDPADGRVLGQMQRAEIRESDRDPSVLAMRFSLVQRDNGEFGPLDDELFEPGISIALEIEPPGGTIQRIFDGYITHLRPHFESIASNAYLEILAMDAAVLLDAEERAAAWPDMKTSDVVVEVLSNYNITAKAQETDVQYDEDRQRLTQRSTDWRFIQHLAHRSGARFYFEYDEVAAELVGYFGPPATDGEPQPDIVIMQDGQCLNWADLQLLATEPTTVRGAAIDPIAKQIVRGEGPSSLGIMGADSAAQLVENGLVESGAGGSVALLADPFPLDEAIGAQSVAATDRAEFLIELRGELDPALYRGLLRARRPVLVRGVGSKFSGVYYIESVRTTLEGSALLQTFVGTRNGTGQTGQEEFGQSAEEVPAS